MCATWGVFVQLTGCGIFSPDEEPPPPGGGPAPYPVLSHPHAVLEALEKVYENRDSIKVKEIYDYAYTGSSEDLNDPGGSTILLTHEDERRHLQALASVPGLQAYLNLGSAQIWGDPLPSDDPAHPDWRIILIQGATDYELQINEPGQDPIGVIGEDGTTLEFAFEPTPNSSSPSGAFWKIIRWRERGKSEPTQ